MTQQAYRYLIQRVQSLVVDTTEKTPAHIHTAQLLVDRYRQQSYLRSKALSTRVNAAKDTAREIIHGGDYAASLKAVKKLESMKWIKGTR